MGQYDEGKARQKIIAVLARMVVLPPEMVKADVRFQDMLNTDPSAMREFAQQVEKALRMPDGSTRERIYAARGHEKAAQLAMDDGAAAVLSVEREDAEDGAPSGHGATYKVLVPLLWGLFIGGAVFVFFWWRRGFEKFW